MILDFAYKSTKKNAHSQTFPKKKLHGGAFYLHDSAFLHISLRPNDYFRELFA